MSGIRTVTCGFFEASYCVPRCSFSVQPNRRSHSLAVPRLFIVSYMIEKATTHLQLCLQMGGGTNKQLFSH